MQKQPHQNNNTEPFLIRAWRHLPLLGCLLFSILYFVTTLYYPGGSPANKHANGFDWLRNYWCNLLNREAINGEPNAARPWALIAMAILAVSLVHFWWTAPVQTGWRKKPRRYLRASGVLAVVLSLFITTALHDLLLNLACVLGLVAIGGVLLGLQRSGHRKLFRTGCFIIVLIALNNLCYYNNELFFLLAVVQKATFAYVLAWIGVVNCVLVSNAALKNVPQASTNNLLLARKQAI